MTVARQYVAEDDRITNEGTVGDDVTHVTSSGPVVTSSENQEHPPPPGSDGAPNYSRLV